MTLDGGISRIIEALSIPPEARVDIRVPKKLLLEQGVPTSADKKAIQDGIDELQWLAACKPVTVGVPAFTDEVREYLEIAVVACAFRPGAKSSRLIELIHRAIPYPVLLLTTDAEGLTVSVAHKRQAQNEAGRIVIERVVASPALALRSDAPHEQAFLDSLALPSQRRDNLWSLYRGWLARVEALNAARIGGTYAPTDDPEKVDRRRAALAAHTSLEREIAVLRSQAKKQTQLSRRVELNTKIQALQAKAAGFLEDL